MRGFKNQLSKVHMKLSKLILAISLSAASIGVATAADPRTMSIDLKATINDSIFVSKPDGSTWYDTEELEPDSYKQTKFTKKLPVRIYSSLNGFQVSLVSPLSLVNGGLTMSAAVKLDGKTLSGTAQSIKMTTLAGGTAPATAHDQQYDLEIDATAPVAAAGTSRNGVYTGKLAMIFEATTIP